MNDFLGAGIIFIISFGLTFGALYALTIVAAPNSGDSDASGTDVSKDTGTSADTSKSAGSQTDSLPATGTYYCCNTNGVWKTTTCWTHSEAWCQMGDAGMDCEDLCKDKGFDGGKMTGGSEGDSTYRCVCE